MCENERTVALEVRNLNVSIGGVPVVRGVDMDVPQDATVAVVGASGSGKSITVKAVSGLLPASAVVSGECKLFGEPIELSGSQKAWRGVRGRTVVWLPQDSFSSLDPLKRCGPQVMDGSRLPRNERRRQAERLLADVGLGREVFDAYPHELSGGMRQRVAIAAALAAQPRMMIADEPTTALDAQTQGEVLDLLESLRARHHMTLLLITHDLALAAEHADRLVVFHDGRVVEAGERDRILHHPQSEYTRELLEARARLRNDAAAPATGDALRVDHVSKWYAGKAEPAARDVSITVRRGEIVGLVGESGSGKSTIARCVVGLESPDKGAVRFIDGDGDERAWSRERAQLVFQNPYESLNPTMTVRATLAEALRVSHKNAGDDAVRALAKQVGVEAHLLDRKPGTLSGGQCQRVAIARALAPDPTVLVADEAVTALDANIQTHVLETLLELRKRLGLSILFISHDLNTIRRVSDRVYVMRGGVVLESGTTDEVMEYPQADYTRALIAAMPRGLDDASRSTTGRDETGDAR